LKKEEQAMFPDIPKDTEKFAKTPE